MLVIAMGYDMPYSDIVIKPVLLSLTRQNGAITAEEVAKKTGIPLRTVQRSIQRLVRSGEISQHGHGRRWGYQYYEVQNDET